MPCTPIKLTFLDACRFLRMLQPVICWYCFEEGNINFHKEKKDLAWSRVGAYISVLLDPKRDIMGTYLRCNTAGLLVCNIQIT
jgi:hypothetical protein